MNTIIEPISGNAYHVRLLPETESERRVLHDGQDSKAIRNFYKNALDKKFGKEYKVGQLSVEDISRIA